MSSSELGDGQEAGSAASRKGGSALPFLVIGVGGSAGSLEAFRDLLTEIPADANLTFLFVQHLEPAHKSILADLLARATTLTVVEAVNGMVLQPRHIYVIPPSADMSVKDGQILLTPRVGRSGLHMPVDHLFRSLAAEQHNRSIGVVLSGGGTDGTLGLKAIKAEEGITLAQGERTARHDSMPRSAIMEGCVDHILPPAGLGQELLRIANHPYPLPTEPDASVDLQNALEQILALLRSTTGVDFSQYKRTTILRRIHRRMALRGLLSWVDYGHLLQGDEQEREQLYQDFLIRVTGFFRDEEVFDVLKQEAFPSLVKDRSASATLRFWVAGCSTGEEVYSLAMCLLEFLGERNLNLPVKILATDVNEAALEKARSALYVDNIELEVSAERLARFFVKVNGHYQVGKIVRDLCVFSRHNLTSDPPFSRLDLISCRNVLIYLNSSLQHQVMRLLHYALNPGGYLLLGSSETVGALAELFTIRDPKNRIYMKSPAFPSMMPLSFGERLDPGTFGRRSPPLSGGVAWTALDVQKEADRVVMARFAPVGVVIDENMTVLQFRGRTGPYLEPAPGMASLDLLKMLREGLIGETRAAITRAKTEGIAVHRDNIPLREGETVRRVSLDVIPIKVPPSGARCFVVLFSDAEPVVPAGQPPGPPDPQSLQTDQQVLQLQQELTATREYLQSLVEEHESACEELKSASEELLSSNEELQSTNEELQTAKEETQSANEELATLNDELQHRNLDLARVNNDLLNLLAAVQIPIVMVSRELRIRRFTPMAEKVLNLIPTDVGRPIGDLKPNLVIHDLSEVIGRVIETLTPHESEIQDREGHWYQLRVRPYVTLDNKIEGASLTLQDIDSFKRREVAEQKPQPGG